MENKSGSGIFLGVVAVATLVVAIIGATFAFFSATGNSAEDAITANATSLTGTLTITANTNNKLATNLIPVASENANFNRYPGLNASGEHSCLDNRGNEICSIYEFTITNTANVAQHIYVTFEPVTNTFSDLYFAAFKLSASDSNIDYTVATGASGTGASFSLTPQTTASNASLGHIATKIKTIGNEQGQYTAEQAKVDLPGLEATLAAADETVNGGADQITYTIIVWLQENGDNQNSQQSGSFAAGVRVNTSDGSNGVTGIMSAAGSAS